MINPHSIIITFPRSATLHSVLEKCSDAIRAKHAEMLAYPRLPKGDLVGASRLVRMTPEQAEYDLWLRHKQVV
jgi:hypothetical protein